MLCVSCRRIMLDNEKKSETMTLRRCSTFLMFFFVLFFGYKKTEEADGKLPFHNYYSTGVHHQLSHGLWYLEMCPLGCRWCEILIDWGFLKTLNREFLPDFLEKLSIYENYFFLPLEMGLTMGQLLSMPPTSCFHLRRARDSWNRNSYFSVETNRITISKKEEEL